MDAKYLKYCNIKRNSNRTLFRNYFGSRGGQGAVCTFAFRLFGSFPFGQLQIIPSCFCVFKNLCQLFILDCWTSRQDPDGPNSLSDPFRNPSTLWPNNQCMFVFAQFIDPDVLDHIVCILGDVLEKETNVTESTSSIECDFEFGDPKLSANTNKCFGRIWA